MFFYLQCKWLHKQVPRALPASVYPRWRRNSCFADSACILQILNCLASWLACRLVVRCTSGTDTRSSSLHVCHFWLPSLVKVAHRCVTCASNLVLVAFTKSACALWMSAHAAASSVKDVRRVFRVDSLLSAYALGELRMSPEHQLNGCIVHSRMDVEQAVPTSMSDIFSREREAQALLSCGTNGTNFHIDSLHSISISPITWSVNRNSASSDSSRDQRERCRYHRKACGTLSDFGSST